AVVGERCVHPLAEQLPLRLGSTAPGPPEKDEAIPEGERRPAQSESLRSPQRGPALHRKGSLPMAVVRKLKKILEERFPPPDKVTLRDEDGIIGIVTSKRFRRMDSMQRQGLIDDILATRLSDEEQRQVVLIVGVTPEEEVANADHE